MEVMRKILIFGNSGSGKSTLAKELVVAQGLTHLDLDTLAWLPDVPPQRAPLSESEKKIFQFIRGNNAWVIEGCYTDLLELLAPEANEIIFLNLDIEQCVANAKNRPWEPHKYSSKQAQDENLNMLLDWIRQYTARDDVFSFQSHMRFFDNFPAKKTMYTDNNRNIR